MKTSIKFLALGLAFMALTFNSCSKDGDNGPMGPQGEQGLAGEKGDQGLKGENGNANVEAYTLRIKDSTWTTRGSVLYLKINASNVLTKEVVDDWIVLVYVRSSDFSKWALLPYYTKRNIRVTSEYEIGSFSLERDQNGNPSTQSNFNEVKLVLIEPSSTGTIELTSANEPNFKDYQAVSSYYGIQ